MTPIMMMMMMGIDDGDHEDYDGHDHQAPGFNANVFGWPVVTCVLVMMNIVTMANAMMIMMVMRILIMMIKLLVGSCNANVWEWVPRWPPALLGDPIAQGGTYLLTTRMVLKMMFLKYRFSMMLGSHELIARSFLLSSYLHSLPSSCFISIFSDNRRHS